MPATWRLRRAADQNVPLVLASATPSLESWHRAQRGEYQLVEMPRRVLDRPLPAVRTIDLRDEIHSKHSRGAISRPLHRAMDEALRDGGQVILLLNRRGHSTHIQCPACGHAVRCPHCDLALTFHRHDNIGRVPLLRLPHGRAERRARSATSPASASAAWARRSWKRKCGRGFPTIRACGWTPTACAAAAATSRRSPRFATADVRILLGTQMIAKGSIFRT